MLTNSQNIFSKKNIVYLIMGLSVILIFLSLAGFSPPVIFICISGIAGFILYIYKQQAELLCYSLICAAFYIFYYLQVVKSFPFSLTLILSSLTTYLIFSLFENKIGKRIKIVYGIVLVLIINEILYPISLLELTIILKSLIITAFFYLYLGFIRLNCEQKLKTFPILTHSVIFSVIIILLIYINKT